MSAAWPMLPKAGDIVWCHFPNYARQDPTMKERPALVVSVMDGREPPLLRVAYGTSQKPRPIGTGCFLLDDPEHLKVAGLWKPTRFNMRNLVVVPWTLGAFVNALGEAGMSKPSPILGALHSGCYQDMLRAAREAGLVAKR
ncbi:MAG: type II toxin-antitoxin system PemK/MazF family toxin [Proteobacteria bacterium]|nr:type II toxin-antitoxin system PemK/MazF family toxin [Pseudomonadota bacterium]